MLERRSVFESRSPRGRARRGARPTGAGRVTPATRNSGDVTPEPSLRLPDPCLVVLVGATAAGKSHWAQRWFDDAQVVSSDRLRAAVGRGERDLRASADAFEVLELIVAKRLARHLTTVLDTTGLEAKRRAGWL